MTTLTAEACQRERLPVEIVADARTACRAIAAEIATLIRERNRAGRATVLGLATGSTPVPLYAELIRLHREEGLSFQRVVTFNLDEYHGLPPTHPESYRHFMEQQLFRHVDLRPENTHVPDGTTPRSEVFAACAAYENAIRAAGGLDYQILGIGRTGHIGFNEPGSGAESRTRLVTLDALTRRDAARDFLGEANVPRHAITMGVGTVLAARRVVLMAWGEAKAGIVAQAVEEPPREALPASLLQRHADIRFFVDPAAAGELTRCKLPWLVGSVTWDAALTRRAVTWLALQLGKPVLKLLDEDYGEHGMAELLIAQGPAYDLNIRIFNELQHTITGWPGGKPGAPDAHRPERELPQPKRVLVFSPEPSDEITGMGGTLRRLVDQGHDVSVICLTSGNLAVPDAEVEIATELVGELARVGRIMAVKGFAEIRAGGRLGGDDTPAIRQLKGLIRRGEAKAALRLCEVAPARIRFLDLPFYENGRYRRFKVTEPDVEKLVAVLREGAPHQIFATGHLADPNSVAAKSFEALRRALAATAGDAWQADCRLWLYQVGEQNWNPADITMAVPLSPAQLARKLGALAHHRSQGHSYPVGPGSEAGAASVEGKNRELARLYDKLGLAEYEAIEAFERGSLCA